MGDITIRREVRKDHSCDVRVRDGRKDGATKRKKQDKTEDNSQQKRQTNDKDRKLVRNYESKR